MRRVRSFWIGVALLLAVGLGSAAGKPSLVAYYAEGFGDAGWQKAAFDRVATSWVAAEPCAPGKKAVVICQITRDGQILEAKIGTASGSAAWDEAALAAVRKAAPFSRLPKSWPNSSLEVHWHFGY
jgi:protein TonB